jgi:DNA-binding PadR family transcriptional regulator
MTFRHLKDLLEETDGNLGAHLKKLEDAGYLSVDKKYYKRKPVSWYSLTGIGRGALEKHLDALGRIVKEVEESTTGE